MFEDILKLVKEHFGSQPEISNAIPADQADDVHREIATHIDNHLQDQAPAAGGIGGMLSQLGSNQGTGGFLTNAIGGGLVSSLASKFGLPPAITGAIAASLPGLLQKFMQRNQNQNNV